MFIFSSPLEKLVWSAPGCFLLSPVDDRVSNRENASLVEQVTVQDIQEAFWSLAKDKMPRPNRFPPCSPGGTGPLFAMDFQLFFSLASMLEGSKKTFIILILKRQDASIRDSFKEHYGALVSMRCRSGRFWVAFKPHPDLTTFFHSLFGLHQGCPLPPIYCFVHWQPLSCSAGCLCPSGLWCLHSGIRNLADLIPTICKWPPPVVLGFGQEYCDFQNDLTGLLCYGRPKSELAQVYNLLQSKDWAII